MVAILWIKGSMRPFIRPFHRSEFLKMDLTWSGTAGRESRHNLGHRIGDSGIRILYLCINFLVPGSFPDKLIWGCIYHINDQRTTGIFINVKVCGRDATSPPVWTVISSVTVCVSRFLTSFLFSPSPPNSTSLSYVRMLVYRLWLFKRILYL